MINERVNSGFQPKAPASESKPVSSVAPLSTTAATAANVATANADVAAGQLAGASKNAEAADSERLGAAVEKLNDYVQNLRRTLSFTVEESTGRTVISVYDAETKELIRQIPPEETLQLAERMAEQVDGRAGFFIKEHA